MQKTAIILAGGKSNRLHFDKPYFSLNDKELINHVINRISSVVDEIVVVARDDKQEKELRKICSGELVFTFDVFKDYGPLAGILSGLERASFRYSLVVGCDMPYVNEEVVKFLFKIAFKGYDAVVPKWENGMIEPLHAVYKNNEMLEAIRKAVKMEKRSISDALLHLKNIHFPPVAEIKEIDPKLKTFVNLNIPADMNML